MNTKKKKKIKINQTIVSLVTCCTSCLSNLQNLNLQVLFKKVDVVILVTIRESKMIKTNNQFNCPYLNTSEGERTFIIGLTGAPDRYVGFRLRAPIQWTSWRTGHCLLWGDRCIYRTFSIRQHLSASCSTFYSFCKEQINTLSILWKVIYSSNRCV